MKKLVTIAILAMASMAAMSQVMIENREMGSGKPGSVIPENAVKWDQYNNDIYHAPQYLPGYPTAATIWPRVVDVECTQVRSRLECKGYNWSPEMGRAEYLMIRPVVKAPSVPVQISTVTKEVVIKEIPVIVFKEVAPKPGRQ